MACIDALFDTAQFDYSQFDVICAEYPTSIIVSISEDNDLAVTFSETYDLDAVIGF